VRGFVLLGKVVNEALWILGLVVDDAIVVLENIARRMEASTQQVTNSFNIYNATCTDGVELSSEDIAQAQAFLSRASADIPAILQDASALEARLNQEEVERNTTPSPTPTETLAPTDTPTPTPTFTPEPTATLSPQLINAHTSGLNFILDTVNSRTRGANTLLTQYWNDVTQAGTTDGCRNIRPTIPGDYDVVIEEQVLERFPELGEARDSVNLGLALLRDGWQMFDAACSSGQMIDSAQVGGNIAGAAAQAFTDAQTLLEEVP